MRLFSSTLRRSTLRRSTRDASTREAARGCSAAPAARPAPAQRPGGRTRGEPDRLAGGILQTETERGQDDSGGAERWRRARRIDPHGEGSYPLAGIDTRQLGRRSWRPPAQARPFQTAAELTALALAVHVLTQAELERIAEARRIIGWE